MNLIGDSRLGPYLTFTLSFFKDRKTISELANEKKSKDREIIIIFLKYISLNIFNFF